MRKCIRCHKPSSTVRCRACEISLEQSRDPVAKYERKHRYTKTKKGRLAKRRENEARRARQNGAFSEKDRDWLLDLTGHRCLCCGRKQKELAALDLILMCDHIIPNELGGSDAINNRQPLCHGKGGCNNLKHTKSTDYRSWWVRINVALR